MIKGNILLRKEQCPTCAMRGKDTSKDNLAVYSDGQTHCFSCGTHSRGGKEALGGVKVKNNVLKYLLILYKSKTYINK